MTIDEAREILEAYKMASPGERLGELGVLNYLAKGFLLGWNVAIKKSAEICQSRADMLDRYACDCRGYTRASQHDAEEILNLSVSSESKEPEKKSPQEGK